ncbi:hypothetical protein BO94DRAFT_486600 [Aspergillus sclerotioniger CBS 115572]|uniref:Uncharacterized protein n=1 Tax=Aspergillus sclerotioniger CBS 115572 TaxID=1450535 RepID=A0A317X4I3_9EURO|nr:hypothetical protein BO94DRAFT_486600 [Aspergillus sclerotioniger CBS 115572]PWY93476.1 hypothetical protein BO94DRAFT_486600 [Aspergillus sclerotioniger CBS 115572]
MSLFRNCRTATVQLRGFASSSSLRVGPESPNFIDVPRTIQPDLPPKPRVKGTLPVPRELFPVRRKDKPTEEYIADATPLPTKEISLDPKDPNADYIEWKKIMAEMRRRNLREGLLELHARKQRTDKTMMKRSLEKQKRRERIFRQPEREDVRLTRTSVIQDMLPKHTPMLPDPDREARLAQSQERVEHRQAMKELERQEHLQALYMNARNFITTEAQLLAEIEEVFPDGANSAWRSDHQDGNNIWNLGVPPTVHSIVNDSNKSETGRWYVSQERLNQIAEQLTGGKM